MAGQTNTSVQANMSTDALFRTWGSGISAGMAAAGCVQTSDTGQINWTTVVRASAGLVAGYEIWRFNDSLQSTAPVFIKVEYGSGTTNTAPQIWITVGTGSNGSGTITGSDISGVAGAISTRFAVFTGSVTPPVATGSNYIYGDGSTVACLMWPSLGTGWGGAFFMVERWRNWNGTASGDGVTVILAQSGSGQQVTTLQLCYLPGVAQNPGATGSGAASFFPQPGFQITTTNVGGTVHPQPVFHGAGPRALGPSQYLVWLPLGDWAQGAQTLTHLGTSRSFYAIGVGTTGSNQGWGSDPRSSGKVTFLMRVD